MRKHWPIPLFAAAVPSMLYGALRILTPPPLPPEDPWTRAFRDEGLEVQLRSVSQGPRYFYVIERRDELKSPEYEGTVLRDFVVESFKFQIASFPEGAVLDDIVPEGAHKNFKPVKKQEKYYHVCRVGRHVLAIYSLGPSPAPFLPRPKTPEKLVNRLFEVFKRTAGADEDTKD